MKLKKLPCLLIRAELCTTREEAKLILKKQQKLTRKVKIYDTTNYD